MTIKILSFRVQQTAIMHDDLNVFQYAWRWMFDDLEVLYHFDTTMKVDEDYIGMARKLEVGDEVQLPNKVRLKIWSVDRLGIMKAKTTKMISEDLRGYTPIEMYLVYPRVFEHLTDKA